MNISLRWLEAFLRRPLDPRDVAERLTMLGAPPLPWGTVVPTRANG